MLAEHISYYNNLPFAISFTNVRQEHPHYHKEIEIVLVLKGSVSYKIHHQDYHLQPGDLLIADTIDLHYIYQSSPDVLMLTMHIDLEHFTDLYPNVDYMIFACEEVVSDSLAHQQALQNKLSFLKHNLAKIMMICLKDKDNLELLEAELHELIFIMVNQFQGFLIEDNFFYANHEKIDSLNLDRLYRIIKYIYENYDKKITLNDLAKLEHLSPYYISHLIKDTSGLSFQNFLNYARIEYAEKFLVEDKFTLTQISEMCGFSSSTYFNKCFEELHHISPAEYKKRPQPQERISHSEINQEEAMALLQSYLNISHIDHSKKVKQNASQHLFIPLKSSYPKGQGIREKFPLNLFLDSPENILHAGYYKKQLQELFPSSISISKPSLEALSEKHQLLGDLSSLNIPVHLVDKAPKCRKFFAQNMADALSNCIEECELSLAFFGEEASLFTSRGIPTPYYSLYQLFSECNGNIVEIRDHYMLVKNPQTLFLVLYQKSEDKPIHAHLYLKELTHNVPLISRTFSKEHTAAYALEALKDYKDIIPYLKDHIYRISAGKTKFSCIDTALDPKLDLSVEPGTLIMLELPDVNTII